MHEEDDEYQEGEHGSRAPTYFPDLTVPNKRGCGERKPGGLYACVASSPDGIPLEEFLVDPPVFLDKKEFPFHRAPKILDDIWNLGLEIDTALKHLAVTPETLIPGLMIWVGQDHYKSVSDFVAEAKILGISRRIPSNFPVGKIEPGTRMVLAHIRAIFQGAWYIRREYKGQGADQGTYPATDAEAEIVESARQHRMEFGPHEYALPPFCPKNHPGHLKGYDWEAGKPCLARAWQFSPPDEIPEKMDFLGALRTVGSLQYQVFPPVMREEKTFMPVTDKDGHYIPLKRHRTEWAPGVFAILPLTHFEYVTDPADPERNERIRGKDYKLPFVEVEK